MTQFKIGDRVRVYNAGTPRNELVVGIIESLPDEKTDFVRIVFKENGIMQRYLAYPQQCRRLVKKERRRVYICINKGGALDTRGHTTCYSERKHPKWVEFIEVKRK